MKVEVDVLVSPYGLCGRNVPTLKKCSCHSVRPTLHIPTVYGLEIDVRVTSDRSLMRENLWRWMEEESLQRTADFTMAASLTIQHGKWNEEEEEEEETRSLSF